MFTDYSLAILIEYNQRLYHAIGITKVVESSSKGLRARKKNQQVQEILFRRKGKNVSILLIYSMIPLINLEPKFAHEVHSLYCDCQNIQPRIETILWPLKRPLPFPMWGSKAHSLHITCDKEFENLISCLTSCIQDQLKTHCYNTIGSFLTFYESFQKSSNRAHSLEEFYRDYQPPITSNHYSCVGLSLDLAEQLIFLDSDFPGFSSALFLASCEEDIENIDRYARLLVPDFYTSKKEHVVVALNITLKDRDGILVLDPGYHISHPVIVMKDGLHPQTGWVKPGGTSRSKRFYRYTFHPSGRYVLWDIKKVRGETELRESALIYTHQAFISPVDSTERRSLVYNFKSLLRRDNNGNIIAGIYFTLRTACAGFFTLFYRKEGKAEIELKLNFADFLHNQPLSEPIRLTLQDCEEVLGLSELKSPGKLSGLLSNAAAALSNSEFVQQVLDINQRIVRLGKNN